MAALLLLAPIGGACASAGGVTAESAFGTDRVAAVLEVENRTHEDLALSVRGRVEGVVRSGQRLRVKNLAAGPAELSARSALGGEGAFTAKRRAVLAAGEITSWSIVPDAAGGEPLPEVPGLGALRVTNPSSRSIVVIVDGVQKGRIFAGGERVIEDLPAGAAEVVARPDDDTAARRDTVAIVAGAVTPWRFEQEGATLTVENATDESIVLRIDGIERTRIAPGERWTSTEDPGLRMLSARSEPSLRPYEHLMALELHATATWRVTAGQAVLVVDNTTGEPLSLAVPGHPATALAPGGRERFEALPTGPLTVEARGQDTRTTYAATLDLLPGQEVTWVAAPVLGSIRVENRTARTLTVYTGSELDEVERGLLAPSATAVIRQLPRTQVPVSAVSVGPGGVARRQATTIDLSSVPAATWVVSAITGALEVQNRRDETVEVYVDALRVGDVGAGQARIFTGLETGRRHVECVGKKTGAVQRVDVEVGESGLASAAVRETAGWVVVENRAGEGLVTRGALAAQAAELTPGASFRFKLHTGPQKLIVVGSDSGFVFAEQLEVEADEDQRWVVALTSGRVLVHNALAESVAVTIDGRAQGSLPPDETLAIEDVQPGRRRIQVVGLRSGLLRGETVIARPGGDARVTFSQELGSVLVDNRSHEALEVLIDGALYGEVSPSSLHAFGKVAPGMREIELYYSESHRRLLVRLEVHEGQRARVVAEAPLGVVVVDNTSHQDVRVTVDGEPRTVVPADAGPTLVTVPAGGRHIHVERLGDRTQLGFHLVIEADVAVHVPVPPPSVRLVVVNRSDERLTLFAGEREIGAVDGGQAQMVEELADGETRLMAKDAAGRVRYEELRRLHAGETATWVLASQ